MKLTHVLLFEICFPAFVCAKLSVISRAICLLVVEPSHRLGNGAVRSDPVCDRRLRRSNHDRRGIEVGLFRRLQVRELLGLEAAPQAEHLSQHGQVAIRQGSMVEGNDSRARDFLS